MTEGGGSGKARKVRPWLRQARVVAGRAQGWVRAHATSLSVGIAVLGLLLLALGASKTFEWDLRVMLDVLDALPWWVWVGLTLLLGGSTLAFWLGRFEPNRNKQGQFAPQMWRQWLAIAGAVVTALAFEWVLFGLLAGKWTWPWVQVHALNGTSDSLVQPALALLTPIIALVTAVFAYRKSKIALAEAQRADVAAFQQRFIDAAKLLADPNASTRIAGATALGSLARDWVDNRQECVNVLCGYLKVKPSPEHLPEKGKKFEATFKWQAGERVVREEVVNQLRRILTPGPDVPKCPRAIDVDLRGAWFAPSASFGNAEFPAKADFTDATFTADPFFDGARFVGQADFVRAKFYSRADFSNAEFTADANFNGAQFFGEGAFQGSRFDANGDFGQAAFSGEALFGQVTFASEALFGQVTFASGANFNSTGFEDRAVFYGASFAGPASFLDSCFTRPVKFHEATFLSPFSDGWDDEITRVALGPLAVDSTLPDPPGSIVNADGKVIRDAEWTRAEET